MLTKNDLIIGHYYEAKERRLVNLNIFRVYNDRCILWIGEDNLQYDSPSIRLRSRYNWISIVDFLKWAERDVTNDMPIDDVYEWRIRY